MFSRMELIKHSLLCMKDWVQTSIQNERARVEGKMECLDEKEHHAPTYGHKTQPSFNMTEIEKRRAVSLVIRGENAKLTCS
jgi:hypothetical protein